jgi:hypothetical protein
MSNRRTIVSDELVRLWKEAVVACYMIFLEILGGRTETSGPGIELETFQIRNRMLSTPILLSLVSLQMWLCYCNENFEIVILFIIKILILLDYRCRLVFG